MKRYAIFLILLAALGASPGCMASLGSRKADQARAEDIGATVGGVATAIPGAAAVGAVGAPVFDLAQREAERIAAAKEAAGEPIGLWATALFAVAAAGHGLVRSLRSQKERDELYDATKALEVKTAGVKPPVS
jgi:DNA-binding PucR family transcriptional regulator